MAQKNSAPRTQGLPTTGSKGGDIVGGSPSKVIGPRSATSAISNGGGLNRGAVVPAGHGGKYNHLGTAPYHEKGYQGSKTKDETRKPV
jgi:hypothetical protein